MDPNEPKSTEGNQKERHWTQMNQNKHKQTEMNTKKSKWA